jgi:phosphocarrier protein HPr
MSKGGMQTRKVKVTSQQGLHLRTAATVARVAGRFRSRIRLKCGAALADARSVLSILVLCAGMGTILDVEAAGEDEQQAVRAIEEVFAKEQ